MCVRLRRLKIQTHFHAEVTAIMWNQESNSQITSTKQADSYPCASRYIDAILKEDLGGKFETGSTGLW